MLSELALTCALSRHMANLNRIFNMPRILELGTLRARMHEAQEPQSRGGDGFLFICCTLC